MNISPANKRNIFRILPFGLIWLIFGSAYSILEKGLLHDLEYYPSTGNPYSFDYVIFIFLGYVFLSGMLVGALEIFFLKKIFSERSLGKKIVLKSSIYILVMVVFLVVSTIVGNAMKLGVGVLHEMVWLNVFKFTGTFAFLSIILYIALTVVVSLFYSEVSEYMGVAVLHNFFLGKYHKPKEENRIFMFMDMRSSTTIAEKLGHESYFSLLRDYYSAFTKPIIDSYGEIYQYVGDEIIVTWNVKDGIKDNRFLKCFFSMKDSLLEKQDHFNTAYGLTPGFKAGVHCGKVITGEIGDVKKEIFHTGDVLNTAARIQGLCNQMNSEILISGPLAKIMVPDEKVELKSIGNAELRGRNEQIELYSAEMSF